MPALKRLRQENCQAFKTNNLKDLIGAEKWFCGLKPRLLFQGPISSACMAAHNCL